MLKLEKTHPDLRTHCDLHSAFLRRADAAYPHALHTLVHLGRLLCCQALPTVVGIRGPDCWCRGPGECSRGDWTRQRGREGPERHGDERGGCARATQEGRREGRGFGEAEEGVDRLRSVRSEGSELKAAVVSSGFADAIITAYKSAFQCGRALKWEKWLGSL